MPCPSSASPSAAVTHAALSTRRLLPALCAARPALIPGGCSRGLCLFRDVPSGLKERLTLLVILKPP